MDKLAELKDLANRILVTVEALEQNECLTTLTKPKRQKRKPSYAEHVTMTEDEYAKLLREFGTMGTQERIERLDLYKGSTGKKYASDYLTILSWERRNPAPKPKTLDKERQERMI